MKYAIDGNVYETNATKNADKENDWSGNGYHYSVPENVLFGECHKNLKNRKTCKCAKWYESI